MLKDFDKAFTKKVKSWYSNTIYAPTDIVYNVAFNLVDDATMALSFPLISIYRPSGYELSESQNFAARRQGIEYFYDEENNKGSLARFLVAKLPYQIDLYAKSPETLDDISEDILMAFNFMPKLTVKQKDSNTGESYIEEYDITYSSGPSEQSEFSNDDRVYHYSIVYEIRNARLVNFKEESYIDSTDITVELSEEN